MEITEYESKYAEDAKILLGELQEYIVAMDPYHFNIMKDDYQEQIFIDDMNEVNDNDGKVYLAISDDSVIGLIMGVIRKPEICFDYESLDNMGEVTELIVTKNTRSKGVGDMLLKRMEEYFKECGCRTISIDVFGYNDVAKSFYSKNGYHTRMITMSKLIK